MLATTNQPTKMNTIQIQVRDVEAKVALLFLYFQSVQVRNSGTQDCQLDLICWVFIAGEEG